LKSPWPLDRESRRSGGPKPGKEFEAVKINGIQFIRTGLLWMLLFVPALTFSGTVRADEPSLTDLQGIKQQLVDRLKRDSLMQENNIDVGVTDGTVTLTGTVKTLAEKRIAERDVRQVVRSWVIDNQLTTKTKTPVSDSDLQQRVQKAINGSIFYSVFDWVQAYADGGTVTLEGVVEQPWHKGEIERVAESVPGVKKIINKIERLPASIGDEEIRHAAARAIYHELFDESKPDYYNAPIHIIVLNGDVTLAGVARSLLRKQEAANLVEYWTTPNKVTNGLKVE
jgi:osmotically-inducible protein OsmY